ncbi:MAG TPA: hypothetical protein VKI44_36915 [Acetobacteraceae bacterium]|nr:hypothetical protein [Acetobacteraceae bacterium]
MFAIAFDLVVADTAQNHPKGVSQAYADIGSTLGNFGFNRVQGSLYTTNSEDLANLFSAMQRKGHRCKTSHQGNRVNGRCSCKQNNLNTEEDRGPRSTTEKGLNARSTR